MYKRGIFMPYQKKTNETIYQDKDVWINQRTGEVIEADQVIKKFLEWIWNYIFKLFLWFIWPIRGQKYKVFKYIIENKNSDNQLIITTRELAEKQKHLYQQCQQL